MQPAKPAAGNGPPAEIPAKAGEPVAAAPAAQDKSPQASKALGQPLVFKEHKAVIEARSYMETAKSPTRMDVQSVIWVCPRQIALQEGIDLMLKAGVAADSPAVVAAKADLAALVTSATSPLPRDPQALVLEKQVQSLKACNIPGLESAIALAEAQVVALDKAHAGAAKTSVPALSLEAKRLKKSELRSNFERSHVNATKLFSTRLNEVALLISAAQEEQSSVELQQAAELDKYQQDLRDLEDTFGPDESPAPKEADSRVKAAPRATSQVSQETSGAAAEEAFTQMITSQRLLDLFPEPAAAKPMLILMKDLFGEFLRAKDPEERAAVGEGSFAAYGPAAAAAAAARPSPLLPEGAAANQPADPDGAVDAYLAVHGASPGSGMAAGEQGKA